MILWVNIELPVPRQASVDLTLGEYRAASRGPADEDGRPDSTSGD